MLVLCTALLNACKTAPATDATDTVLGGESGDLVAIFFTSVDCPVANAMAPQLSRTLTAAHSEGVRCVLVYPRAGTTEAAMQEHAKAYNISAELRADPDHALVQRLNAKITPEAFLLERMNDGSWSIQYRGRVNDLYVSIGNRRDEVTQHDLAEAINQRLANAEVSCKRTDAVGCMIQRRD